MAASIEHRHAAEVADNILQGMSVAKWMLDVGRLERGIEVLDDTIAAAQALVTELLADTGASGRRSRSPRPDASPVVPLC
jgi:hypothetical protein